MTAASKNVDAEERQASESDEEAKDLAQHDPLLEPAIRQGRPSRRRLPKGLVAPPKKSNFLAGGASKGGAQAPERTLMVGAGIEVAGQVAACSKLVVEGVVRAELQADSLEVRNGGCFDGTAEVTRAEVHGELKGDLTVQGHLHIGRTGRVSGNVRYAEIDIESGGRLSGTVGLMPAMLGSEQTEVA